MPLAFSVVCASGPVCAHGCLVLHGRPLCRAGLLPVISPGRLLSPKLQIPSGPPCHPRNSSEWRRGCLEKQRVGLWGPNELKQIRRATMKITAPPPPWGQTGHCPVGTRGACAFRPPLQASVSSGR